MSPDPTAKNPTTGRTVSQAERDGGSPAAGRPSKTAIEGEQREAARRRREFQAEMERLRDERRRSREGR